MTFETHTSRSSDPDEALRQALRHLASGQGAQKADALGRRVMADWRQEMARSAHPSSLRFADGPTAFQAQGRRRIGLTALIAGMALLLMIWVKLPESPPPQLKQVDVLSQMSLGGL